jgi:hypothetical protein
MPVITSDFVKEGVKAAQFTLDLRSCSRSRYDPISSLILWRRHCCLYSQ